MRGDNQSYFAQRATNRERKERWELGLVPALPLTGKSPFPSLSPHFPIFTITGLESAGPQISVSSESSGINLSKAQILTHQQRTGQTKVAHTDNGILFSLKKGHSDTCYKVDEP